MSFKYAPLCQKIVNSTIRPGEDFDEFFQEAQIAAWKATESYDLDRSNGYTEPTYVAYQIRYSILETRRKQGKISRTYFAELKDEDEDFSLTELDITEHEFHIEDDVDDPNDRLRVKEILDQLSTFESWLIWNTVVLEVPLAEIAQHYGVSGTRISQLKTRALKKARQLA